jgi:hypothetical protein
MSLFLVLGQRTLFINCKGIDVAVRKLYHHLSSHIEKSQLNAQFIIIILLDKMKLNALNGDR